ncbi:MAG: aminotransferase class III-fold pyridoxal phosphate-dependent enzyme [Coriobacteriaceae bacterium]|jgi:acetylornithine aminotransferase|nr:aminotransferase class III-fold pyridoxal phosphate-dependent enzyme [Coriobacteriaceae bacterium]
MGLEEQQELESRYVMHTFARKPLHLVSGRGMELIDSAGKRYLDFIAGIGVVSLGHCHPAVVKAVQDQAARLMHVGNYYYVEKRGQVARMLSDLLNTGGAAQGAEGGKPWAQASGTGGNGANDGKAGFADEDAAAQMPWQSFFANSGAEANECAIKLARLWNRKQGRPAQVIVTLQRSFHGRTLATLAATAQAAKQDAFQPLPPGFIHSPANDIGALEELFAHRGNEIAAVLVECVQGEGGVYPCTPGFLRAARDLTSFHGGLLICDEVQTGIYRCGSLPFAFQHFGIMPDIVTIAKGVASGFPTGMCAARAEVASAFEPGDHGSTFGGSSLALAAAEATLIELSQSGLPQQVTEVGTHLCQGLATLPHVTEVRGLGLMCACDLEEGKPASEVVNKGHAHGLLLNATGPSTLRFLPPLICTRAEVDVLIAELRTILSD